MQLNNDCIDLIIKKANIRCHKCHCHINPILNNNYFIQRFRYGLWYYCSPSCWTHN